MTGFVNVPKNFKRSVTRYNYKRYDRNVIDKQSIGNHPIQMRRTSGLQVLQSTTEFEPIAPGQLEITGFAITFIVCVIAGWVWANQVVPVSRTKLAISKRKGAVREYLDELKADTYYDTTVESDITTAKTNMNSTDLASQTDSTGDYEQVNVNANEMNNQKKSNRAFEKWLFTDWLQQDLRERKGGRQKEPALPILKDAKWNSGDNPILVATALIASGVIVSSIVERILSV